MLNFPLGTGGVMKIFFLIIMIHFFAYSVVKAEESSEASSYTVPSAVSPAVLVEATQQDECQIILPQLESDYKEIEAKFKIISDGVTISQENYLVGFNQMTQILFQMVKTREEETAAISQSRDRLKASVENPSMPDPTEASKNLQSNYLDLTVRLYSSLMDAQKSLDTLKEQLSLAESTRGQLELQKQEMETLDHQKLAIEGKLVSLKIKCQSGKSR